MGVEEVKSEEAVMPVPPVRRLLIRPEPSTMTEPESPLAEKAPDSELNGRMAHSLEVLPCHHHNSYGHGSKYC
jgi:hypothetical protein